MIVVCSVKVISVLSRIRSARNSKTYVLAILRRIVARAKVVLHLFKKPLFSGSIGNAIAFNTSNVLRLARNLVRKIDRSRNMSFLCRDAARIGYNISARLACLNYSLRKTRYPVSVFSRRLRDTRDRPKWIPRRCNRVRVVTSSFTPDITWD